MRRLTLFRHAKSSWSDPELPDNERPLSSRGERDAQLMATRLRERGERPDLILTSHARRATATARALALGLGCPENAVQVERRLYLAPPDTIVDVARHAAEDVRHLLLVGHNPGFTDLANRLVPSLAVDDLPTSAAVALEVDAKRWSDLSAEVCRLRYYDYPKKAVP